VAIRLSGGTRRSGLGSSRHCDTHDGWATATNLAVKLTRTFADLLEALNRHRGKG
jgi:hypothetical protein